MTAAERNKQTIADLYAAFGRCDGDGMAVCYRDDAVFEDPAFGELAPGEAVEMWRMLTERATDLQITLVDHDAGERTGSAHWLADYTFQTGRKVHNDVEAAFRFDDAGLIADHRDSFSLNSWSRQALGLPGLLLGWSPLIRVVVQKKALAGLREYQAGKPSGA